MVMFGHQDDEDTLNNQANLAQQPTDNSAVSTNDGSTNLTDQATSSDDQADDESMSTDYGRPTLAATSAPITTTTLPTSDTNDQPLSQAPTDELIDIKQKVLNDLTPIVDHIEQTPEEKFNTTMMMIQASDNPSLIKNAYAAANQITDDKIKAQALLDIVNEINYFTQPSHTNN